MSDNKGNSAVKEYAQLATATEVHSASPHRLVQMLLEGALDKIAASKGFLDRGDLVQKNNHVAWAISIINGLRMSLDHGKGGDIASNLDDLYDYMCRRLLEASHDDDIEKLDEVTSLLLEIKSGWDAIGDTTRVDSSVGPPATTSGITESA